MFGDHLTWAKAGVAFADYALHAGNILEDFGGQLGDGSTAGQSAFGRFAAGRKISQPKDSTPLPTLTPTIRACAGFACGQAAFAILNGAAICQVQMVQYFRGTPFAFRMARQILSRHAFDCGYQLISQFE